MYPVVHNIENKDKQNKLIENQTDKKKIQMLLDSNPHLLSAKTLDYPLDYWGIVIYFI